ncbi:MAG TPA: hypothetical protein VI451_16205 [Anaerolineales bacterium]|nr:hypothetical protein [Anaerolineales bacterium]
MSFPFGDIRRLHFETGMVKWYGVYLGGRAEFVEGDQNGET